MACEESQDKEGGIEREWVERKRMGWRDRGFGREFGESKEIQRGLKLVRNSCARFERIAKVLNLLLPNCFPRSIQHTFKFI